jgi:hypothetical protein
MEPPLKVQAPFPEIVVEVGVTPPASTVTVSPVAAVNVTTSPVLKTVASPDQLAAVLISHTLLGPAVFQVILAAWDAVIITNAEATTDIRRLDMGLTYAN